MFAARVSSTRQVVAFADAVMAALEGSSFIRARFFHAQDSAGSIVAAVVFAEGESVSITPPEGVVSRIRATLESQGVSLEFSSGAHEFADGIDAEVVDSL